MFIYFVLIHFAYFIPILHKYLGKKTKEFPTEVNIYIPGSLTPSDLSEDWEDVLPEYSWLPCERSKAPRDPFLSGDGFDVYVDGCRFLPDSVTFTKVCFNSNSFLYFSIIYR